MRIGLIGYANNTGIGNMLLELSRQFPISAFLIIPNKDKGTYPELVEHNTIESRLTQAWQPTVEEIDWLLDRSDVVVTVETDYRSALFARAKVRKIRTVLYAMWEWWDPRYEAADLVISISNKCQSYVSNKNKIRLEWGLDLSKFEFRQRGGSYRSTVFVHNAGFGGMNWRKGTIEATEAFMMTKDPDLRLLLRAQFAIEKLPNYQKILSDKRIIIENNDFPTSSQLYQTGDVLLYPSRYDGHALVVEEAMACGMPVLFTDAEPMNDFGFDRRMLIPVERKEVISIHANRVDMNFVCVNSLADRILQFSTMDISDISMQCRKYIEKHCDWNIVRDSHLKAFSSGIQSI